jgi:hypothetical protein
LKPLNDIIALYLSRKAARDPVTARMTELRDAYNGDLVIPLPEMDKTETSSVANLIAMSLDQMSMRMASTLPNIFYPPTDPGATRSEAAAQQRILVNQGWWTANNMSIKMRQRSRWFYGYGNAPVVIRPNVKKHYPQWKIHDPLSTFTSTFEDASDMSPLDTIFAYEKTRGWIKDRYPQAITKLGDGNPGDKFTVIEYQDAEEVVLAIYNHQPVETGTGYGFKTVVKTPEHVELLRHPNLTGVSLVVVPRRITLDKPMGQFDALIGMHKTQAELQALDLIAVKKGIFPDMYLVSNPDEIAAFTSGPFNGRTGKINEITGGRIEKITIDPSFSTSQAIDRLERNMRVTAGSPAEFGGESQTNVRTGRRGDSIIAATIDFNIQEAQELFSVSLEQENKCAVAVAKAYFGNEKKTFSVNFKGEQTHTSYVPNVLFDTDDNTVTFPLAGADANSLAQSGLQKVGAGTMSKKTQMENDPQIGDANQEHDRITVEAIESAITASMQQQIQAGRMAITDAAKILSLVQTHKMTLADAMNKVHQEAQALQATQVQPQAPEAQPGITAPGSGAEASIAPPAGGTQNLAQLLGALKGSRAA